MDMTNRKRSPFSNFDPFMLQLLKMVVALFDPIIEKGSGSFLISDPFPTGY